jgi:serine/threonine protein phosphatase PrpC
MGFLRRIFNSRPEAAPTKAAETPPAVVPVPNEPADPLVTPTDRPAPDAPTAEVPAAGLVTTKLEQPGVTRNIQDIEPFVGIPGKHLAYGINSDKGVVRQNNQDSLFAMLTSQVGAQTMPDFGLFVVADGMGGHENGERASALAARIVGQHVLSNFYLKRLSGSDSDDLYLNEILTEALQKANEMVASETPEGGTTVTAAAINGSMAYIAHVGDSRAYLITEEGIDQITHDHSLVQRLIDLDHLTPDEAAVHPQRNVLYRAIGQNDNLEIDTLVRRLPDGARLMLCSDGLWNMVNETELRHIITSAQTPQEACDRLIELANQNGGNDNITVILVQIPG